MVHRRLAVGDVLVQGAALGHVEQLDAPADGQDRQTSSRAARSNASSNASWSCDTPYTSSWARRAVRRRVEVAPARQQEPVEAGEELGHPVDGVGIGEQHQAFGAGAPQRAQVPLAQRHRLGP